jgi:hypothetical protein
MKRNRFERKQFWHNQGTVLGICLEGLRKTSIRSSLSETYALGILEAVYPFLFRLVYCCRLGVNPDVWEEVARMLPLLIFISDVPVYPHVVLWHRDYHAVSFTLFVIQI